MLIKDGHCSFMLNPFNQTKYHYHLNISKMKREKLLETIKALPQEFELDEFLEKLIFVDKVEQGLKQLDEGETKDHATVKR